MMQQRGSYAKSAIRREAILVAAMEVLAQGYRGGLVQEVVRRANVTEAMLWYHFPSKAGFVAAVLKRRDDLALRAWRIDVDDPAASLRGVTSYAAFNAAVPGAIALQVITSAESSGLTHGYHLERQAFLTRRLTQILEDCSERGLLASKVEPARAARGIVALMDGLQVQRLADPGSIDAVRDLELHIHSLLSEEPLRRTH